MKQKLMCRVVAGLVRVIARIVLMLVIVALTVRRRLMGVCVGVYGIEGPVDHEKPKEQRNNGYQPEHRSRYSQPPRP